MRLKWRPVMDALFKKKNVHVKNESIVRTKFENILQQGPSRLQLVADFDRTLARSSYHGRPVATSFHVFEDDENSLTEYKAAAEVLRNKYYPIELDHTLTPEQKEPFITQWYIESFKEILKSGIKKQEIPDMVARADLHLRHNVSEMFKFLESQNIPILVYSAGLGNVIELALEQQKAKTGNVTLISNYIEFDPVLNTPKRFLGQFLHSYNKNGRSEAACEYYKSVKVDGRSNAILLGDSLGDCSMADGGACFENSPEGDSTVLKIGFLDDNVQERLPTYMENYDIVLTDDETVDVAWDLFKIICQTPDQ